MGHVDLVGVEAIVRAPWSLRGYALLVVATAVAAALAMGDEASWVRACWAVIWGILVCTGTKWVWWFAVVLNSMSLLAAPFVVGSWWLADALGIAALALLLLPESRLYVFRSGSAEAS